MVKFNGDRKEDTHAFTYGMFSWDVGVLDGVISVPIILYGFRLRRDAICDHRNDR